MFGLFVSESLGFFPISISTFLSCDNDHIASLLASRAGVQCFLFEGMLASKFSELHRDRPPFYR